MLMSSFNTNEELDQEPCGLCRENCGQSYTCSSCGQSCDSYVVIQRGCDHTTWVCFSCESEDPKNTCERCAIDLQEDSDEEEEDEDEDEEKKEEENNNNNNNDSSGKPTAGPYGPTRQQEESLQQRIDALKQQQADFIRQLQQANVQSGGGGGGGGGGGYGYGNFGDGGGDGPAPKKKQPKKVSANSRRQCTLHLQRVAMAYMPEFSKLCKELDLVNKETEEAQFNIMTLDDVKARKLIKFVKRKMRAIIQKEKNQQQCDKQG